ncbi:MFS transporter [Alicyclobacillus cycloheptanicus]|uniref:YNFM family putative membrane transporter n=1 Tax=Alicyclobacillus cycloheptanicus TaxID=1457 RepID=A0ABT9XJ35_9BACL|nr:MFS transporter [Alicyclobacillus cycloheptanicus]MDQ0190328.1 YNFM family putative membrane transporter [Alicyclobacillus cycloheptanicus]WDM00028.1 MFS transporter [Alicyclobacillus cycloheptanicus]
MTNQTSSYIERGNPAFFRAMSALFAGGFTTFAILYSTQPLMPTLSRHFHVAPATASLSLSVTTATLSIAMVIAAGLSESIGRKRLMKWSLVLSSVLAILLAFSPNFGVLLALRTLQGIVLAGLPAIAMAYVSEEFAPQSLGVVMGMYISGTTVGGMVGRIAVGMLSDAFSWHVALAVIGVISLLCAIWFWVSLPLPTHFQPSPQRLGSLLQALWSQLRNPGLLCLYVIGFTLMGGFVTLYNYIGYLLMGPPYNLSQSAVGWIFIVYLMGTLSSTWMGRLADRHGRANMLVTSIAVMLCGLLVTLVPELAVKIVGIAVFTFGFFGGHSIASGWVGRRATHSKAQASSLYLLFYYIGSSVMGALGGIFWSRFAWNGVVAMIGLLIVCALGFALFVPRVRSQGGAAA